MAVSSPPEEPVAEEGSGQACFPVNDPVIASWMEIRGLFERAGKGKIIRVPLSGIDRQAVIDNADILEPVISCYGHLAEFRVFAGIPSVVLHLTIPSTPRNSP